MLELSVASAGAMVVPAVGLQEADGVTHLHQGPEGRGDDGDPVVAATALRAGRRLREGRGPATPAAEPRRAAAPAPGAGAWSAPPAAARACGPAPRRAAAGRRARGDGGG